MVDNQSPLHDAQSVATNPSVVGWFFVGFLLGIIGLLIVYLRSPRCPAALIAQYRGDDRYIFEESYIQKLKNRQTKITWIGFVISLLVAFVSMIFLSSLLVGLSY